MDTSTQCKLNENINRIRSIFVHSETKLKYRLFLLNNSEMMLGTGSGGYMSEVWSLTFNPLSPHDALKHHFTSPKTDLIVLQPRVLEQKFPCNWFTNT